MLINNYFTVSFITMTNTDSGNNYDENSWKVFWVIIIIIFNVNMIANEKLEHFILVIIFWFSLCYGIITNNDLIIMFAFFLFFLFFILWLFLPQKRK